MRTPAADDALTEAVEQVHHAYNDGVQGVLTNINHDAPDEP